MSTITVHHVNERHAIVTDHKLYCGRNAYKYPDLTDARLGNMHPVGYCNICGITHARGEAIPAFEKSIEHDESYIARIAQIRSYVAAGASVALFCHCAPQACHCDVIRRLALIPDTPAEIRFNSRIREWAWLSNMHPCRINVRGRIYPSVENAYQACKTDKDELRVPFESCGPFDARTLGKSVPLRKGWNDMRLNVMEKLLEAKFRTPSLKRLLIQTGNAKLVEEAPWDGFWGTGRAGLGFNHMGKLLMKLRETLTTKA